MNIKKRFIALSCVSVFCLAGCQEEESSISDVVTSERALISELESCTDVEKAKIADLVAKPGEEGIFIGNEVNGETVRAKEISDAEISNKENNKVGSRAASIDSGCPVVDQFLKDNL